MLISERGLELERRGKESEGNGMITLIQDDISIKWWEGDEIMSFYYVLIEGFP